MNDRWLIRGKRWAKAHPDKARVARRFRHHVKSRWNPNGRIVRLSCAFRDYPSHRDECEAPIGPGEAHHVDYDRPFAVVWLCAVAHRRVDHGGLKLTATRVCDYTSLVAPMLKPGLLVEGVKAKAKAKGAEDAEDAKAPF